MAVDSLKITALDVRLAVFQFPATIWGVNTLLYKVSISIVSSRMVMIFPLKFRQDKNVHASMSYKKLLPPLPLPMCGVLRIKPLVYRKKCFRLIIIKV